MTLLLDTHYAIELLQEHAQGMSEPDILGLAQERGTIHVSAASLWEVAIKSRLGKLPSLVGPADWPDMLEALEVPLLHISPSHILVDVSPEPSHKDPFDRLLLGVCAAEGLQLVTRDRALASHPLAWRPFP
jgi:PIN domain nuclease of toxin-antitoxin system